MKKSYHFYTKVLSNYTKFDGRARRSEFWHFVLFHFIVFLIGGYIIGVISNLTFDFVAYLIQLYILGTFLPFLAVAVRRLHDVDKSGWFLIIPLYNLILLCSEGTIGQNQYGDDPKSDKKQAQMVNSSET